MSMQQNHLKIVPPDSNVAHTFVRIKNKFGVDLTAPDGADIEIDMFAEGETRQHHQQHNKDVELDPILEKLEAAIYRKANFKPMMLSYPKNWSNWIKSMYKVSKELHNVAMSTKANPDIRKFNKENNEYLRKLKRLRQDLMANKLSLDLIKDIPSFPNMKNQKGSQYKQRQDKNPEQSKKPLMQDPVDQPIVYQAQPTIYEPLPSPTTHVQSAQAKAKAIKTTITRTFTAVPVAKNTTNNTHTTSTSSNTTINRSVGSCLQNLSGTFQKMPHTQPQPTHPSGAINLGLIHTSSYPKGIPRSFLKPDHPMAVNYKNHQAPPDQTAYEPHQVAYEPHQVAQNEQYNPEENFMDDHNDNSQDGTADGNDPESMSGQKRVRAFDRLGPITQPKKPKLTINLLFSKEQAAVREVIDDDDVVPEKSPPREQYVPVIKREEVVNSTNPIVIKFRYQWPWDMTFSLEKTAMPRNSKSVMIMEAEQMLESYDRSNKYVQVNISGYPPHFTKEDVLDILLENARDKHCVPTFIDFKPTECNFLLLRSRAVLHHLHRKNLVISQEKLELPLKVSTTDLGLESVALIPKKILKNMLNEKMIEDISLDLQEFCLQPDITHFMYYPLKHLQNQIELMDLNSSNIWSNLKELNLSHNKLTTIEGFNLPKCTPHLQYLDLSFNYLSKMVDLLCCRGLSLRALKLEGNPLCGEYIDPDHYVKVARIIFPRLREFDGIPIPRLGETPDVRQNYCPPSAKYVAEKFIETFIPLLDQKPEERMSMEELYSENAVLTITFRYRLRYTSTFKYFRDLFSRSRCLEEIDMDSINGAKHIVKHFTKWPEFKHDPYMTTVDVMSHDENTTILRIGGVIRLSSSNLTEDEHMHMLSFSRTVVLHTKNGNTYKIYNEMIQWDEASEEITRNAFQIAAVKQKELTLIMETEPDDFMKEGLAKIFMEITGLNEHQTERCLKLKSWNFKDAVEYFMKLVKLGSTDILDLSGN